MELRSARFHLAANHPAQFPRDGLPQLAFAGRSNVGKSSLINTILRNKKIARVSRTPGKTHSIHFILVNERFYVVDLPGYGYAKVSKSLAASWGPLIRGYLETEPGLRLLFLLLDARRIPAEKDLDLCAWLDQAGRPWQPILTKADKLSNNELQKSRRAIAKAISRDPDELIVFSNVTRRGVAEIWRRVGEEVGSVKPVEKQAL